MIPLSPELNFYQQTLVLTVTAMIMLLTILWYLFIYSGSGWSTYEAQLKLIQSVALAA
jgi:hypothetical protein